MPEDIQNGDPSTDIINDPNDAIEAQNALDALLKEATGKGPGDEDETPSNEAAEIEAKAAKAKADKEAADAKAAADEAAKAKVEDTVEKKDDVVPETDTAKKDEFDAIELPPHAKPKTVEGFTKVKEVARARIAELNKTVETTKAELEAARAAIEEAKVSAVSPEDKKELEELRNFRRGMDVEADPEFKRFDKQIADNVEMIYARLKTAGFDDASIKKIKELGGPANVDWVQLGDKVPREVLRLLDVKLVENETIADNKAKAIKAAKAKADDFFKNKAVETEKSAGARKSSTETSLKSLEKNLPFLKLQEIPKDAKPEVKAQIEAANKHAKEIQADLTEALNDDSPEMRAVLLAGYAKLIHQSSTLKAREAAFKVESDKFKAEIETLKGEVKKKDEFIAKVKSSSTGRLSSNAPTDGKSHQRQRPVNTDEDTGSALDRLKAEVEAANA